MKRFVPDSLTHWVYTGNVPPGQVRYCRLLDAFICHCGALADRPFRTVSMGEQRLVLLARALVKMSASYWFWTNPAMAWTLVIVAYILDSAGSLCQRTAVSIIYVTHNLDELPQGNLTCFKIRPGSGCGKRSPEEWNVIIIFKSEGIK